MVFIFKLIGPFIIPLLVIYIIYSLIKNRQRIKAMKDLHDANKTFKEEWENVTQSQEYKSSSNHDVIDADYTIKEEE